MKKEDIKKTWKNLLIPFIISLLVLIVSVLSHRLGSKRPTPQTLSFFGCILGLAFMIPTGIKILKFRKYLKSLNN